MGDEECRSDWLASESLGESPANASRPAAPIVTGWFRSMGLICTHTSALSTQHSVTDSGRPSEREREKYEEREGGGTEKPEAPGAPFSTVKTDGLPEFEATRGHGDTGADRQL